MLVIECGECHKQFVVKGYTTPDSFSEPGEVVTELETCDDEELCDCLKNGIEFNILDEDYEQFDDDVIQVMAKPKS